MADKGNLKQDSKNNPTTTPLVTNSLGESSLWDSHRYITLLKQKASLDAVTAEKILKQVQERIRRLNLASVEESMVLSLIAQVMEENKLGKKKQNIQQINIIKADVNHSITRGHTTSSLGGIHPGTSDLAIANMVKREYSLEQVMPPNVSKAHQEGDIHIHGLGFIDRFYSTMQSLEYLKRLGLDIPGALNCAKPAKHPSVLISQMARFTSYLQSFYYGTIAWDAVNYYMAPFLERMPDSELNQVAQSLLYEFAHLAGLHAWRPVFSELHLYWEIPPHLEHVPALGKGGKGSGKTYFEYSVDAQRFAWAIFDLLLRGDSMGKPFIFPRIVLHITDRFLKTHGAMDFLNHACRSAGKMGTVVFCFDRKDKIGTVESLQVDIKNDPGLLMDLMQPWKLRFHTMGNVSINLPRIAYKARGNTSQLIELVSQTVDVAIKAHKAKRQFINKLINNGDKPLSFFAEKKDGKRFQRNERTYCLINVVGLNEMVQYHLGKELHVGEAAISMGEKILTHINNLLEKASQNNGIKFLLHQAHSEKVTHRMALSDLKRFSDAASKVIKGDINQQAVYYTNSSQFNISAPIEPFTKIEYEGRYHKFFDGGATCNIWLGEQIPARKKMAEILVKAHKETDCQRVAFLPEFTICPKCDAVSRSLLQNCPICHSKKIEHLAQIAGHYALTSRWNKGKLAELKDRFRFDKFPKESAKKDDSTEDTNDTDTITITEDEIQAILNKNKNKA